MYWLPKIPVVFLVVTSTLHGDDDPAPENDSIANLIKQLGDNSFRVREAAGEKIFTMGEPILPHLYKSVETTTDFEIRNRSRQLIGKIILALCNSPSLDMKFVYAKAGHFTMGSNPKEKDRRDDEMQHAVRITRAFLIGATEVTQDEFHTIMDARPSWFSPTGQGKAKVAKFDTGQFPVDSATWFDAVEFCNRLSKRDGFAHYYSITDPKHDNSSIISAKVKILGGTGYRLPTEAEWEYACRAGTSTPFHFGTSDGGGNYQYRVSTRNYGIGSKQLGRTTTVRSYKPNAWGIYDMHGNVAEWCWDWYSKTYYANSPGTNPSGPASGDHRVLRGGRTLSNKQAVARPIGFGTFRGKSICILVFELRGPLEWNPNDEQFSMGIAVSTVCDRRTLWLRFNNRITAQ